MVSSPFSLLQTIALPVVNGFVLTSLIQREYQDCTLRNTLCAPVSRSAFLLSKTVIWFLWFFLSASAAMLLTLSWRPPAVSLRLWVRTNCF